MMLSSLMDQFLLEEWVGHLGMNKILGAKELEK